MVDSRSSESRPARIKNVNLPLLCRVIVVTGVLVAAGALVIKSTWRRDLYTFRSDVLAERRSVLVRLPASYSMSDTTYPVLYLLDGGDQRQWSGEQTLFSRTTELLSQSEGQDIPEMILVGIGNRDRVRDMTPVKRPDLYLGGGDAKVFLRFLCEEVTPFIDARFRTTRRRILYGESYGGLFVLYALAQQPSAYTDYISVSPTVGVCPDLIVQTLTDRFTNHRDLTANLFIAWGEHDIPLVTTYIDPLLTALTARHPPGLRLGHRLIQGEGHNPKMGITAGLRFVGQAGPQAEVFLPTDVRQQTPE